MNDGAFNKAARAQQAQLEAHFFGCIERGDAAAVADFLRDHAGAHAWRRTVEDADGESFEELPLHKAAILGHLDVARELVLAGAPADAQDSTGTTPLMLAAAANKPRVVEFLLEEGANPNKSSTGGSTPLSFAAINGAFDCIQMLADAGADVNAHERSDPPLFTAVRMDSESAAREMARLLFACGADPDIRNGDNETAEELAAGQDRPELAAFIRRRSRDLADERAEDARDEARRATLRETEIIKEGTPSAIPVRKPLHFRKPRDAP